MGREEIVNKKSLLFLIIFGPPAAIAVTVGTFWVVLLIMKYGIAPLINYWRYLVGLS